MRSLVHVTRLVGLGQGAQSIASWLRKRKDGPPASAVTLVIGRGDASIFATVRGDGRARLAFGSGEEFAGPYDEMPRSVTRAARELLDMAGTLSRTRRSLFPDDHDDGPVRVTLEAGEDVRRFSATLRELRDDDSRLSPLWRAFTDWLGPFLVVLFGDEPAHRTRDESPALSRARAICRRPLNG